MGYINQAPALKQMFDNLDSRLRLLETAVRFTAPSVNFATSTPANPRQGDIFYDTNSDRLVYWDGSAWYKLTQTAL
jgi:hypothetical protein